MRPSAVMHACARAEARYCLSRNRIGPVKLEEGSTTCPFCKISSTPSQANCTAMRRVSGISGRHAVVRARGASEGQQVFVRPRLRTSSRILASSAPSASGLHSSRWRFGIVAPHYTLGALCGCAANSVSEVSKIVSTWYTRYMSTTTRVVDVSSTANCAASTGRVPGLRGAFIIASTPCFCVGIGDQHSGIVRLFEVV